MSRGASPEAGIDNTRSWAMPGSGVSQHRFNRRRPWHQRLLKRLTHRTTAHDSERSGSRAASPVSVLRQPLVACGLFHLLAATTALACAAWAPALVFAGAAAGSFLCHHRRLSHAPHPS